MPTIDQNKLMWNSQFDWDTADADWSSQWGSAETQWQNTIYPRIRRFIPTGAILEIAPGFGRWTQYLAAQCETLTLVDLSEKCIQACRERFEDLNHISYFVNDGKSLDFIPDHSVDFVFSFDSLVHAEEDVIAAYLEQLAHKLTGRGVGFIHHSNLGEYAAYLKVIRRFPHRLRRLLANRHLIETLEVQWRSPSMTAAKFEQYARHAGLVCITQEIINWQSRRLIDCISVFTRPGSCWAGENRCIRNENFVEEARYSAMIERFYTPPNGKSNPPIQSS